MKALKGVLIYIGIILGVIVGLGLILLCVMYFVPSIRVFGVGVVHYNTDITADPIELSSYSDYSNIQLNVNSKKINISVVPDKVENIEYDLKLNIFGISTEIVEYKVTKTINVVDDTLQIFLNISEPNGWISTSTSALTVKVPASNEFDLLTNSKSGNITIGNNSYSAKIKSLAVSTESGNLNLVNLGEGTDEKTLSLKNLNMTTGKGTFDLTSIDNIVVENEVKLVADDGVFKFKNINASLDVSGDGITIKADNVICDSDGFKCIAKNGFFTIGNLSSPVGAENTIITDNIGLNIGEITGKTGIVTIYGDITITTLNDYSVIENENGKVTITTAKDMINIKTTYGDINVDSYLKTGKFTSDRGNITVNSNSEYVEGYYTEIVNVDGNVNVYNEINRLLVTTRGRSSVEVVFGQIMAGFEDETKVFQHKVKTSSQGKCVVYIPTLPTVYFKFIAKGEISGEIAGFGGDNDYYRVEASDDPQYFPNDSVADETLLNASFEFDGKIELKGYSFVKP